MGKLKILVLFDSAGTPPADQDFREEFKSKDFGTEKDVITALKKLGHYVRTLGVYDDINIIVEEIKENEPDVVFNLTEQFLGHSHFDRNVVGLLELLEVPYTGSNPAALMLCKNKGITKKILTYHKIKVPNFAIFYRGKKIFKPQKLRFPLFIKPLREEASTGIAKASFVEDDKCFIERVEFIQETLNQDVIAEEYIDGREFYVSILGNKRLQVFPIREIKFGKLEDDSPKIATYKAKWDLKYRKKWGIRNTFATGIPEDTENRIFNICKRAYKVLHIHGYGRIDLRLTKDNEVYILEANPNPHIEDGEDFAKSAEKAGINYPELIQRIVNLVP